MPFYDECGVFGIHNATEASRRAYLGLYALQHRGQESAGICSRFHGRLFLYKAQGYVADIFDESRLDALPGNAAIGHTRYSTTGGNVLSAAHPFLITCRYGQVALCHNGNLTNTEMLRQSLIDEGHIFSGPSDSEVILALIARSRAETLNLAVVEALRQLQGAYSLLILTETQLLAARDPHGLRPLSLGKLDSSWVFSSETCAFDLVGAHRIRDVEPGELISIDEAGLESLFPQVRVRPTPCIFEHVYFSRPDSVVYGLSVMATRREMGRRLAKAMPVDADLVVPVPDSGVSAALGYAEASGIPFDFGLIRNHYVGRTFIEPKQHIRSFGVKIKLNPVRALLDGQRVILVDDSLVRGTTSRKIVQMVREAGAKEIHLRISSPPTTHSCFYGIDTPAREQLIASHQSQEEIRQFLGADSLAYLPLEDLRASMGPDIPTTSYCCACFTGDYPIPVQVGKESPGHP